MIKIISRKRYEELLSTERFVDHMIKMQSQADEKTLHCGYKSCQFHTTDPKGLKIHRARMHRRK